MDPTSSQWLVDDERTLPILFIVQGRSLLMVAVQGGREEKMPRDASRPAIVESPSLPSTRVSECFEINFLDRAIFYVLL